MSTFLTTGILLARRPLKDAQWSLTVFTEEFGKIHLFYRTKSRKYQVDIGSRIQVRILKKGELNILQTILKHQPYIYDKHSYQLCETALWFFHICNTILAS